MSGARGFIIVAVVVTVLLALLRTGLRTDPGRRNLEIFTEMVYSPANESFSASVALPLGKTQQDLVPGVVARGRMPFRYGPGPDQAARAGAELANPFQPDDVAALEEGRRLYATYCTVCHDPAGDGRGPVVLRGMLPPPSLHAARATAMPDGELFHVLTRGQGNMASYAAQMSPEERWKVVLHVRRMQMESAE
jgi:mono/diheme cytochrome c family protein